MTDATVALGFLPPALAGGAMRLDVEAARRAIETELAGPLGLSVEEAAVGVRDVANANMARAIRAVTVERGVDPRDFTLLAFGGSGPVHACDLAAMLGIRRVLFPRAPGVFTAMGMLAGHVERYFIRAVPGLLHEIDLLSIGMAAEELTREALTALGGEGYEATDVDLSFELDLRFRGQDSELPVAVPARLADENRPAIREAFIQAYVALYGYASTDRVEVVNLRLTAKVRGEILDFTRLSSRQLAAATGEAGTRRVFFNRRTGWVDTPVIDRAAFADEAVGPLILQSPDSTIVVPPGAGAALDAAGNVIVSL